MKRVLLLGDSHGNMKYVEVMARRAKSLKIDTLVVLGDFGFVWQTGERLLKLHNVLTQFDMRLLFLDGNHENFDLLEALGAARDAEGPVDLTDRITYLPRGYAWEWEGVRLMSLGGAYSIDRDARVPGQSWWFQELITLADVERAKGKGKVDILLSHDAPEGITALQSYLYELSKQMVASYGPEFTYKLDATSRANREMLDEVCSTVLPSAIFHGHYHHRYDGEWVRGEHVAKVYGLDRDGRGAESALILTLHDGEYEVTSLYKAELTAP